MTIFARSHAMRIARTIASSLQVPIAATCARIAPSVRADSVRAQPVGDGRRGLCIGSTRAASEAARRVVGARGLRAEDVDAARRSRVTAIAVPDSRPPPPNGAIDRVEVRMRLLDELERGGALPRDDARVVVGMHERGAGRRARARRTRLARDERWRAEVDLRAEASTFAILIFGALSGITTCAGMPRRCAAYASAAP